VNLRYDFKIKDLITTINLFLSFYSVILVFQDRFLLASVLVTFNIMVLDVLDGVVARISGTENIFGKYFDSVTDFVGSSVIVCFFIYHVFEKKYPLLGLFLSFIPLLVGVLREVRSQMGIVRIKGYFIGYPRNSSAVVMIAVLNSTVAPLVGFYPLVILYLLVLSYLQLSKIPFVGNDKPLLMKMPRMKFYLLSGLILVIGGGLLGYFWDAFLLMMTVFMLSSFIIVDKKVWNQIS